MSTKTPPADTVTIRQILADSQNQITIIRVGSGNAFRVLAPWIDGECVPPVARITEISSHVARICKYRRNETTGAISLRGHGYSFRQEIAERLSMEIYGDSRKITWQEL